MANRLPQVRRRLADLDAEALLLTSRPDVRWACGFTGSNGLLVVGSDSAHFVTDGRYTDQAQAEVEGASVHVVDNGLDSGISEEGLFDGVSSVAFQADSVSVARRDALAEEHESVHWSPVTKVLTRLLASKEEGEVDRLRSAQSITEAVFDEVVDLIEPGMTEREVAAEIVYRHLRRGADSMSFDPIVASGPNAARPHARPTDRTLRKGELVVIDMGGITNGYASDMTRTVALGEPKPAAREGYEAVLRAQKAALDAAQAGMTGEELDAVARSVLDEAGLESFFTHGLGHGIGLQVHEWPRVSRTSDAELPEGACVTIEPGVYVPDESYGVRIEDIVVLRNGGSENLTRSPKDLLVL
ncbi:MAG: aminopeptidase P family protein [Bacteroidetes bacterium QH_2_64_26]|nr:MAG: aminopeptidase P family protein [Bacteroidetes bacterium QH_2_64_26]